MRQVGRERRRAYRVAAPGLRVRVIGYGREFEATDLSVSGIGFLQHGEPFKLAQTLKFDLFNGDGLALQNLPAIVARVGPDVAGCVFLGMDEGQQEGVVELVLRLQKAVAHTTGP